MNKNNISNNISNNNTVKSYKSNNSFNKKVSECIKKCDLFNNEIVDKEHYKAVYKDEDSYQSSFDEIIDFSKSVTEKDKQSINVIIYNKGNEDGLMCAYIAWGYFNNMFNKKKSKSKTKSKSIIKNETSVVFNKDIVFIPLKPASSPTQLDYRLKNYLDKIKGKTVLLADISYGKPNLEFLTENAKKLFIIDDHPRGNKVINKLDNTEAFIGDDKHSACAFVWKFFYPRVDIPPFVQYVDSNDRKLNLPFLLYANEYRTYLSFRITYSPYLKSFETNDDFMNLHKMLGEVDKKFSYIVGKYYLELQNNIKDQVARNAVKATFQGHPVYVLNYNDPVMYKMVGRQMITNAEKKGDDIHFAVLWGWEYTSNAYKVFLSEKHTSYAPRYNLPLIGEKLGRLGGHPKGGKGSKFVGNFYWPHNNKYDIWDLFSKQLI
jgi:hypothetical protein